jgi:hypothetical protein
MDTTEERIKFDVTKDELKTITEIVERARNMGYVRGRKSRDHWSEPLTMIMDLEACHSNGCPLDFERWLKADDFNFAHDVAGIARHMDRETGQLTDCFLPRFAKKN